MFDFSFFEKLGTKVLINLANLVIKKDDSGVKYLKLML